MKLVEKVASRKRRHRRLRRQIVGTSERPRLNVFRSKMHIYAQIVDDTTGRTLAAASTVDGSLRKTVTSTGAVEGAKAVGRLIAERAKAVNVEAVVFDRGGRVFHGRIKALAEASREGGLKF